MNNPLSNSCQSPNIFFRQLQHPWKLSTTILHQQWDEFIKRFVWIVRVERGYVPLIAEPEGGREPQFCRILHVCVGIHSVSVIIKPPLKIFVCPHNVVARFRNIGPNDFCSYGAMIQLAEYFADIMTKRAEDQLIVGAG